MSLVTIIMCNKNYGQFIGAAIESVLNQNYPKDKLRLCIIDDNSSDNSHEVIQEYVGTESTVFFNTEVFTGKRDGVEIKFIKNRYSAGPSHCRNLGIELYKDSDVFGILDADDEILPDKTAVLVNTLSQHPNIGVAYADYIIEGSTTRPEYKKCYDRKVLYKECIVHSGAFIKASAMFDSKDQFGYYDYTMRTCEDYDLWMRIAKKYMIIHVPEILTKVRETTLNSTSTVDKTVWYMNTQRVYQKCQQQPQ